MHCAARGRHAHDAALVDVIVFNGGGGDSGNGGRGDDLAACAEPLGALAEEDAAVLPVGRGVDVDALSPGPVWCDVSFIH